MAKRRGMAMGGGWKLWQVCLVSGALWVGLALGWSWYVVNESFAEMMTQRLCERGQHVAGALRAALGPVEAGQALDENILRRMLRLERESDGDLAYVMVWDNRGNVMGHTVQEWEGSSLPAGLWPPLEAGQEVRVVEMKNVPWEKGKGAGRGDEAVRDVTVAFRVGKARAGYVSLGYPESWVRREFWEAARGVLTEVGVMSGVGLGLILLGIYLARRMIGRAKELQEQGVRARTSLLTERGMLASVLAHEVRSPLTALRFNLYALRTLIAGGNDDTKRKVELSDSCEREIRRLDLMLNDFLQRTQVVSSPAHTSVNQVVNEALDFLRPALERKHVRVVTHLDGAEPMAEVNADELRQVLLNLAANAQDAMPRGGTLVVSTVSEESSVTMLVRDSGVGIPVDLQQRIFEPFFTTKPAGSGLGLALVRRVISGAGGTIFCESVEGEGTTFRIVLPRAAEEKRENVAVGELTSDL